MFKKFTRLVCVGIACFCMLTAMGQERENAVKVVEEKHFLKNGIELRANERQQPDSVVGYDDRGYRDDVYYYPAEGPMFYYSDYYKQWCNHDSHFFVILWPEREYDVKYNSRGLAESMTYSDKYGSNLIQFQYNTNGYLLSQNNYERSIGSTKWEHLFEETYLYDVHENWVGRRSYYVGGIVPELRGGTYNARTDNKGRIVYSEENMGKGGWMMINGRKSQFCYYIWHCSDDRTPTVEVENNNPIGNNNQGDFDLDVNVPTDSISNGIITITFPEGFTLDEKNTSLTVDFTADFTLKITKQDNSSWLLEVLPKSTRSVLLRADEVKKMLHVAYTVNPATKRGTYNIVMDSIIFNTPGGNIIPEPALSVPAAVDRWGVDNELISNFEPIAYVRDNTLYIQATQTEQVSIYSISGTKLYETTVQSAVTAVDATIFPKGVLIVKGSTGWVKKLIIK